MKKLLQLTILLFLVGSLQAQTIDDGLMMGKNKFCTGLMYSHDQWKNYWEGDLKRENGNIGTVTTRSLNWLGNYGISNKINVIAMLPYVWTKASGGTMHPQEGVQDLTLAVKYRFLKTTFQDSSTIKAFVVGSYAGPMTNYTPDFLPLSIGSASQRLAARLTLNYTAKDGWYVNGSGAFTYRNNVMIDAPAYYTEGQMHYTNEVFMPNVFDFSIRVGYFIKTLQLQASYVEQNTLGGGDIRRQATPFVSNRMNYGKVEALVMYYLPMHKNLAIRGSYTYTVAGRNVGQSTMLMGGLLYTFNFLKTNKE